MSGLSQYLPNSAKIFNKGVEVDPKSLAGKIVFFYFSASWCPPCRGFTPLLIEFYEKFHESKNFEVVFVTWDEEEDDFNGYYGKMPWATLPFSDEETRKFLTEHFKIESIPTVIGVHADTGKVVTTKARQTIVTDPEGASFPWTD